VLTIATYLVFGVGVVFALYALVVLSLSALAALIRLRNR
jgi:hypothetical protein